MSYYANAYGTITFPDHFTQQQIDNIRQTINEVFLTTHEKDYTYDIYPNTEKYYEDEVLDTLNKLIQHEISGEIYYQGEDFTYWRFVFSKEHGVKEQYGRIVYEDM